MNTRLVDTDLPISIIVSLKNAGIETLEQLACKSKKELLEIPLIGTSAVSKIKTYLATENTQPTTREMLGGVIQDINISRIAAQLGKSPAWLYHKLDGVSSNGKNDCLTDKEREQLRDTLYNLANRIQAAADNI